MILVGDCRDRLAGLEAGSVQTVVTSPPYFGLRDYGTGEWEGGEVGCDHLAPPIGGAQAGSPHSTLGPKRDGLGADNAAWAASKGARYRDVCGKCGATRVDRQIGLEPTPDEFVAALVGVFREVRRVLRDDGTVWLNLGDSFCSTDKWGGGKSGNSGKHTVHGSDVPSWAIRRRREPFAGVKPKDLLMIPARVAMALQEPYYTGTIKDERDRIWLAAMIDAEGCMFIHKRKVGQSNGQGYVRKNDSYGAGLEISSTDRVIVENVLRITGRGSICEQSPEQNPRRKQTIYRWNLRSNECRDVIREVYPYLVAKQHEARLVLGCPSSGPDAARAHESLKSIHQGGSPDIDFAAPEPMFERGWFLRSDIIWAKLPKPNPMPESVTDRPTKAHEYLFLLSKGPRYFYDADAIADASTNEGGRAGYAGYSARAGAMGREPSGNEKPGMVAVNGATRNKRSVWTVATQPYAGAHFATFPPKLIEPCVLAGSPPKCCGVCGAPWRRVVEREGGLWEQRKANGEPTRQGLAGGEALAGITPKVGSSESRTVGWESTCDHDDDTGRSVVLDPFAGAGTVGVVCGWHGREFVGCELNPEYAQMARDRIALEGRPGGKPNGHQPDAAVAGQASIFDLLGGEAA